MVIEKPFRVTRTFTQQLVAPPSRVFHLICPVREAEWCEGWDPLVVFSESGAAEPDCVFVTAAAQHGARHDAVWLITRHEPGAGFVEMIKITPETTACKLSIQLAPSAAGCAATVTYSLTSLGPEGDAVIAGFTQEYYLEFMRLWEAQMNHYLLTGELLKSSGTQPGRRS